VQGILRRLQKTCYFTPLSDATHDALRHFWDELCAEEASEPGPRELMTKVGRDGCVWGWGGWGGGGVVRLWVYAMSGVADRWRREIPSRVPPPSPFNSSVFSCN
jgi:hypothetical protein